VSTFKFLGPGAVGTFSGHAWPPPAEGAAGAWTAAAGELDPCRRGIHLCREGDLPFWIREELYVAEPAGDVVEHDTFLLTRRARLVRRVGSWDQQAAYLFSSACAWRTRDLAARALRGAGQAADAEVLLGCTSIRELEAATDRVLGRLRDVVQSARVVGYAADAVLYAQRARTSEGWAAAAATTAFISAAAAHEMPGASAATAASPERAEQGRWIAALAT
jgi:hypothetical protein